MLHIIDGHHVCRCGLPTILNDHPVFRIIEDVGHRLAAIEHAKARRSDVAVMRTSIRELGDTECIQTHFSLFPQSKVIVISECPQKYLVEDALTAGVSAFVHEKDIMANLINAIMNALLILTEPMSQGRISLRPFA